MSFGKQELERLRGRRILLYSGTVAATGNSHSSSKDVSQFKEASFFLNVTAASGTTPTLAVKVVTKNPGPGIDKWGDVVSFTQATGITHEVKPIAANIGERVALEWTAGGTTPSFTFSVYAYVKI